LPRSHESSGISDAADDEGIAMNVEAAAKQSAMNLFCIFHRIHHKPQTNNGWDNQKQSSAG